MKTDVKEALMGAAVRLLKSGLAPEALTAREIAADAGANLAMINYYYESKDRLVYLAVGELMRADVQGWLDLREADMPAREKLRQMLRGVCETAVRYESYTRASVAYELTRAEIRLPQVFLPLMRQIAGPRRDELSLRLAAYGIVSTLQLIFLRSADFGSYAEADVYDPETRDRIIDALLDAYLPKGE